MSIETYSEALTWNELADEYDATHGGRRARTQPMNDIFDWAEKQTDKFFVDPDEGTIHKIKKGKK
ncbi:MAG: hypothetical protein ACYSW3_02230 [Planctomycetota bacterium]|jgi:hypothetical protein